MGTLESEPKKNNPPKKLAPHPLENQLRTLYDPESCGMGELMFAFKASGSWATLPKWAYYSLVSAGSNQIQSAFIHNDPEFSLLDPSTPRVPIFDQSLQLAQQTFHMYDELAWAVRRDALEQLTGIATQGDKTQPISDEELQRYLEEADKRGLVERSGEGERKSIKELLSKLKPPFRGTPNDTGTMRNRLLDIGVRELKDLYKVEEEITRSTTYQDSYMQAATYKLAVMLGYTEYLVHVARILGDPVSPDFIPQTNEFYQKTWMEKFGEEMPPFGELYAESLRIFKQFADPNDPNLAPFFALQSVA